MTCASPRLMCQSRFYYHVLLLSYPCFIPVHRRLSRLFFCESLQVLPDEVADDCFSVLNFIAADHALELLFGKPAGPDALVLHGLGRAGGETGGEKDGHLLAHVTGAGVERDQFFPLLCAIASLLDELALGGLQRFLARIDLAGRQLPQIRFRG